VLRDLDLRQVLWGLILMLVLRPWLGFEVLRVGHLRQQANVLGLVSLTLHVCLIALLTSKRNIPRDLG
jgi:hypothetical protein